VDDLDVAEAGSALNGAQAQRRVAQGQYIEARRALEVLAGRYPAAEVDVATVFAALPPPVPAGLPSELLQRRPDLLAIEQRVLAAFRLQEAAKLSLLPSIVLTAEGGRLSDQLLSTLRLNPWIAHVGVGVSGPVYQGGALIARIKAATAEQELILARYGSAVLRAFFEVETALTNELLLGQRLEYEQRARDDRIQTVRIATLRYKAGAIDLLSVLQLQAAQISSQASVIRLRAARLSNRINLHLALGGSFDAAPAATGLRRQEPE
jgi:outer membrane protein TolC